jgi:hypothetical protein
VLVPAGVAMLGTDAPHFPEDAEGPAFSYNPCLGAPSAAACLACPAGYLCNATGIATDGVPSVLITAVPTATFSFTDSDTATATGKRGLCSMLMMMGMVADETASDTITL